MARWNYILCVCVCVALFRVSTRVCVGVDVYIRELYNCYSMYLFISWHSNESIFFASYTSATFSNLKHLISITYKHTCHGEKMYHLIWITKLQEKSRFIQYSAIIRPSFYTLLYIMLIHSNGVSFPTPMLRSSFSSVCVHVVWLLN